MSWILSEEGELVNSEGCFSSADRTALDVSPVMSYRLRPGLGEAAMNSAEPDTLFFDRQSFELQFRLIKAKLWLSKKYVYKPI